MEINQTDRNQLKTYFSKNAIPSEQEYTELIDGMLNQKDDRIVKQGGEPLCLEASGDAASERRVLRLYESFDDANPAWHLSLNPRSVVSDPATARPGLSIDDSTGVSRLFVDRDTGHVGIGTIAPTSPLHVAGEARLDGGMTIQFGQPIAGIPVTMIQKFQFNKDNGPDLSTTHSLIGGGLKHWEKEFVFPHDLTDCHVAIGGWHLVCQLYSPSEEMMIETTVTTSGSTATVGLKFGWRDTSDNWDDAATTYFVDVLVIGTMNRSL